MREDFKRLGLLKRVIDNLASDFFKHPNRIILTPRITFPIDIRKFERFGFTLHKQGIFCDNGIYRNIFFREF